jgi:simple sugar transport system permease protein
MIFMAVISALGIATILTFIILNPPTLDTFLTHPAFPSALGVNVLVGSAIVLFGMQNGVGGSIRILLTVGVALLIGFVLLSALAPDPVKAFTALITGPLSRLNRWGNFWLRDAISLMLAGLALAIVFKARLFSLGAEGQIVLAALASGLTVLALPTLPQGLIIPIAVGVGCLVAFLWGALPGILRAYLDADELVSTLMLNQIAALIYSLILNAIKPPTAGYTVSPPFPATSIFPRFMPSTNLTTVIGYTVIAVIAAWILVQRTPFGYALRMVGANPEFARYGGINTKRTIWLTVAISGAFAGVAGAYLSMSVHRQLILNISGGLAFEGVVVALLARNNVLAVPAMALLYAYLRAGGEIMQTDANVSHEIVRVIQAIIILLVTAEALGTLFKGWWSRRRSVPLGTAVPAKGA